MQSYSALFLSSGDELGFRNLPQLPPDLEYRTVGRDLVLRDVGANLIVDVVAGVNLRESSEMAVGFDEDRCFMVMEVAGDGFYFQTVSRTGKIVDSGVFARQQETAR